MTLLTACGLAYALVGVVWWITVSVYNAYHSHRVDDTIKAAGFTPSQAVLAFVLVVGMLYCVFLWPLLFVGSLVRSKKKKEE